MIRSDGLCSAVSSGPALQTCSPSSTERLRAPLQGGTVAQPHHSPAQRPIPRSNTLQPQTVNWVACCGGAMTPPARGAPHLRPPQPIRNSSNKQTPQIPRQCHVTRSAAVPRVSRAFQLRARVAGGKTCATWFTMGCTAELGAKEVRREGSGGCDSGCADSLAASAPCRAHHSDDYTTDCVGVGC